jgi:hypothetical protein
MQQNKSSDEEAYSKLPIPQAAAVIVSETEKQQQQQTISSHSSLSSSSSSSTSLTSNVKTKTTNNHQPYATSLVNSGFGFGFDLQGGEIDNQLTFIVNVQQNGDAAKKGLIDGLFIYFKYLQLLTCVIIIRYLFSYNSSLL